MIAPSTSRPGKKVLKKKNNAGTFNVENPSKAKKTAKSMASDDSMKKKKKPRDEIPEDDGIEGMEVVSTNKKRKQNPESNEDSPPKKKKFDHKSKTTGFQGGKKGFKQDSNKFSKGQDGSTEKPDWNKLKEEKKVLREKRRAAQRDADSYEVSVEARKVLESVRSKKCPPAEQQEALLKLHKMLKGKLLSVVYAHDMSRVVETMLKLAHVHKKNDILKEIILELVPEVVEMSKQKYATHVVKMMITHCLPTEKHAIVQAFQGKVFKMLNHKVGKGVLELLYSKAKPEDRHFLQKELYGPSYKLITSEPVTGLDVLFKHLPTMKESTLANTKEILNALFEKDIVESHIMHTTLLDYLSFASPEDSAAMLEQARNHIKALSHTKEGVHVAMMCVWMGTPKARKKIVKDLKGAVASLACGEHTHFLLLSIFDSMDDTILINKVLLSELFNGDLTPLLSSTYGRKVLMYLCSWRDPKMFSAPIVAILSTGDSNAHSKKDQKLRATELRDFAVQPLLRHIAENTPQWMGDNGSLLLMVAVLKAGLGEDLQTALRAVAKHVVSPTTAKKGSVDVSVADNTGCHMMLKKLVEHDKVLLQEHQGTFSAALLSELKDEHYAAWLKNNRCCFLLLNILKTEAPDVVSSLRSQIKKHSSKVWKKSADIPAGGVQIKEIL